MEILALIAIVIIVLELQAFLFNKFSLLKLDYKCEYSVSEAHEGDDIYFVETVHNNKFLPVPWLKAEIHTSRWLDFAESNSVVAQENRHVTSSFLLRSYQKTTRRWKLKCTKRGVFTTENVSLVWGNIFGYHSCSMPVSVNAKLIVYPEIIDLDETFICANYLQGNTIVRRWIIDDPFIVSGAREYGPGDSMNRIHWRATAKEGKLMVRKNDFTSQLSITVILNIQSMEYEYDNVVYRDIIEMGIKVAATIFDRALAMGSPVSFVTNGCTIEDSSKIIFIEESAGKEHVSDLLKILAKLKLTNVKDFEIFMEDVKQNINNSDVFIITAYINEGISNIARSLKLQGNMVKVILLDKFVKIEDLPQDIDVYIFLGVDNANEKAG